MAITASNSVLANTNSHTWLVDTRATDHMCCTLVMLTNITQLSTPITVALPNGASVMVTTFGSVYFTATFYIQNVLFVPCFQYNLFSVPKWSMDTRGSVLFTHDKCVFQDQNLQTALACGSLQFGLYHLDTSSYKYNSTSLSVASNSISKQQSNALWHMRLAHVSSLVLHKIPDISSFVIDDYNKHCPICPIAKQSKLPFTLSTSHASASFDLVHIDVWGPYAHETYTGYKYFLTVVDDFSRAIWTFLLPSKLHVFSQIKFFCAYVSTRFKTSVKAFRTDHGSEFFNNAFMTFMLENGITHQSSCVNTPAPNGRVERKHRQLLAIARSLRFQSGLPIKFWGECILTATYIINRLPTPVLKFKTPFECLFNELPDYSSLKVFGCLCYASVHESDKF